MSTVDSVYLRCRSCRTLNRVPTNKLMDQPHCGKCKGVLDFPTRPIEATARTFGPEVFDWAGVAIVEFWSPRCGPCTWIQPLLERLVHQKAGLVKVVKVNIDREPSIANTFNVMSTPTLLVYRNGKLVDELRGAYPEREMQSWLQSAINR